MEKRSSISLKHSVKLLPKDVVEVQLQELGKRMSYNENNHTLISIKNCQLHVLNDLKAIISEICECLIINANQAAITLTNHLYESMLKQALIIWDSKGKRLNEKEKLDEIYKNEVTEYGDKNMESNINRCKSKGLITKEEAKRLVYLKSRYRDTFSHASSSKLFKDVLIPVYKGNLASPLNIRKEYVNISRIPMFCLEAQKIFADANAYGYFIEIYSYIDNLDRKLLDLYPDIKSFL